MKHADVVIGGRYWTRVSGDLVEVEVIREKEVTRHGYWNGLPGGRSRTWRRFVVKRTDNGTVLPKARSAAALRVI